MRTVDVICLAALLLGGCREGRDETAFAVVDGKPLTAAFVKDSVLIKAKIFELSGNPIPEADFIGWANRTGLGMIGSLINSELLENEIQRAGVVPTDDDRKRTLANYNSQAGQKAESLDELAVKFGELERPFRCQFERSVRLAAYGRIYWKTEISDGFLQQYFVAISNDFKRAQRIDADAAAKAKKAYARLRAGEDWLTVATECSEDKALNPANAKNVKEWMWVGEDAFGIKELAAQLPKMGKGDFTEPIETREGLAIIRLEDRNLRLNKLARMLFRMARPIAIPADREKARSALAERMLVQKRAETLSRLQKAATITYPLGQELTYKIWKDGQSGGEEGE